jgi:hypothetical protein
MFVVQRRHTTSDVGENRLLKLFLTQVREIVAATKKLVGTGAVLAELEQIDQSVIDAMKKPQIREVSSVSKATALMRSRARRHRNRHYGQMAELQAELQAVFAEEKWSAILRLLESNWVEPIDDDDLFELFVLVTTLDILEKEAGLSEPINYGLIKAGRKEVAKFQSSDREIDVYFDQGPARSFSILSEYGSIISDYIGFNSKAHRPDIIIRSRRKHAPTTYTLIEVKRSEDETYQRDSVYKVLGYLKDFADLWPYPSLQSPKAILVFPEKVTPKPNIDERDRDLVLVSSDDRERFKNLIRRSLN